MFIPGFHITYLCFLLVPSTYISAQFMRVVTTTQMFDRFLEERENAIMRGKPLNGQFLCVYIRMYVESVGSVGSVGRVNCVYRCGECGESCV